MVAGTAESPGPGRSPAVKDPLYLQEPQSSSRCKAHFSMCALARKEGWEILREMGVKSSFHNDQTLQRQGGTGPLIRNGGIWSSASS